ncbi:PspC domain-containing protein [Nocardia panacis]|uniref:PspC domain-containing protein n=1 Tax=Nocardia panacis TaxID=2340916 RepID=A0A3A4KE73_9NOCA|nr:PspC domain-containing protein [Nocardia panacis]RJO72191.1 PspC domain-containing protein [Nocardia panacis]
MTKSSFGDQLQQMWHTRPVRLPRQGPIAGVAAGFGQRYGVDPVLVRVALVVATIFGGAGIMLYLLAWLLMPEAGGVSAVEGLLGKGHSSQSTTKTVVLVVALAIAVSTVGPVGIGFGGSGLISTALLLASWWMLHLRTPQPPPGTTAFDVPMDSGLNATGYPGAVFPTAYRSASDAFATGVPPTEVYSPYTKLPDSYVPEHPVEPTPLVEDATVVLSKDIENITDRGKAPAEPESTGDAPAQHLSTTTVDSGAPTASDPAAVQNDTEPPGNDAPRSDTGGKDASRTGGSFSGGPAAPTRTTPPSWDPLGVAPLAWDLPDPTPTRTVVAPPAAVKRPRSRLTPMVIGLAILAAAAAGAVAAGGAEWMTPGRIGAVALAVIGLGLVLGAFLRRGYGLLVLTAPLAGFVILASIIGPLELNSDAVGEHAWAPTSMADLRSNYKMSIGTGTLDLRRLALTENRTVDVTVRMGEARILVPDNMTVRTTCTIRVGDTTRCPSGITGPNKPNDPVLDLNINVRTGTAEVERGR